MATFSEVIEYVCRFRVHALPVSAMMMAGTVRATKKTTADGKSHDPKDY